MSESRRDPDIEGREISLGAGLPKIPERLLLAHARREVLFVCGAGVSVSEPSNLPLFRELVLDVYRELDPPVHQAMEAVPQQACNRWEPARGDLTDEQAAEVKRFVAGEYDVVLGMLERRLDDPGVDGSGISEVRRVVREILVEGRAPPKGEPRLAPKPAPIHRAIMRLADRGLGSVVVTTNFDLLLEAALRQAPRPTTYALAGIPRPSLRRGYTGVLHLHGAVTRSARRREVELVLTEQDFGEFYLRRRVAPDFIYDAARLYNLVLVGYRADDPPMRYLLNAVAADGTRFRDIKERFTFLGAKTRDPVSMADWRARGITPIHYDSVDGHAVLSKVLERWAKLFAVNGKTTAIDREIRRIVRTQRANATDSDRELFDHLVRRSDPRQRNRLVGIAKAGKADLGWLEAAVSVTRERGR